CSCSAIPCACRTRGAPPAGCLRARPSWRGGSRRRPWPRWRFWRAGGGSCCWWPATGARRSASARGCTCRTGAPRRG
ncbi:MAG: hypothetical protein AVDCRST_MAG04-983, partial [uncultured Acetobacteraceae bacterium]